MISITNHAEGAMCIGAKDGKAVVIPKAKESTMTVAEWKDAKPLIEAAGLNRPTVGFPKGKIEAHAAA